MNLYKFFKPLIFSLDPEVAHNLAIKFIKYFPFYYYGQVRQYHNLYNNVFNINFKNPIGLAAGFDKNAALACRMARFGFGFAELGTVTPLAQPGNLPPRIFRLSQDQSIINRLGFNSDGADCFLKNYRKNINYGLEGNFSLLLMPIGINIGKNKDSEDAILDYLTLIEKFYNFASYITINISSPNTNNLRDLQKADQLDSLLKALKERQKTLEEKNKKYTPLLLKIAPDLTRQEQEAVAAISVANQIDGLIVSNTTTARPSNLISRYKNEQGGLSGKALLDKSDEVLKNIYLLTRGRIPIIGVGGISSAEDVYHKISLGASLVQIYTAFVYQGFSLVEKIKFDLSKKIAAEGFNNISEVIGSFATK